MAPRSAVVLPSAVHVELFVVPRSERSEFRRRCRTLYHAVRPPTRARGGVGPVLFLLEERPRRRRRPQNLRRALGVRPGEDLWLELAFYRGSGAMRATLRQLWKSPEIVRWAARVERLPRPRGRAWTLATGTAASDR